MTDDGKRFEAVETKGGVAGSWMVMDRRHNRRRINPFMGRELAEEYAATLNEIEDLPPIRRWRLGLYRLRQAVELLEEVRPRLGGRAMGRLTRYAGSERDRRNVMVAAKAALRLLTMPLNSLQQQLHDHIGYRNTATMESRLWWVDVARWEECEARVKVKAAAWSLMTEQKYQADYPDKPLPF